MSHLTNALRAASAAAVIGGFACLGTATANADDPNVDTLASTLSKGYSLSNCIVEDPAPGGTLAAISCQESPDPNGPVKATYLLYNNPEDLSASFKNSIKDVETTACGDSGKSPTTWRQGNAQSPAGQVACGTYQGAAEIIWTTDAKNVLSYVKGHNTDVQALYQWWRTNG
ncbi:serine/threonine protein kinase [Mycobacterium bourgelatii]|uniref:Serine/threonine protein kinase n=1 Tax=Mycobacterium bourgelatii TaxID=1273442 RepID=A0A7I9YHS9_MYCBU|nr:serine/threonine protein kinase [Mycobacterium bourgelatii]MCV6973293.1 serine/threonine protein kinase [Mycobacterium bourgelatii]GFG88230.1 hypothetical protein MBOU_02720 [Mycobacterium bourgelatii]